MSTEKKREITYKDKQPSGDSIKIRREVDDSEKVTADKYIKVPGGHVHEGYKLNKGTGGYSQYGGGENSDERSYNKNKKDKK